MSNSVIIPFIKFKDAFEKAGWIEHKSGSSEYKVFVDPNNTDLWTRVLTAEDSTQYLIYQKKNILLLLYALGVEESLANYKDLQSQLRNYNYKLINRIEAESSLNSSAIPFELAKLIPEKNIDAFRYFFHTKTKKKKSIPIEKFELNHTEVGSFVIPVSILVEDNENTVIPVQNEMNLQLHNYLKAIDALSKIPRNGAENFAERVMADSIDSKIVKDIYGADNSIARFKDKYKERVKSVSIGSRGSMLLDFNLPADEQTFKEVDLGEIAPLKEEYIEVLEQKELLSNDTNYVEHDVKIDVLVEAIDITGRAKFTVMAVNDDEVNKPFKAQSIRLPKAKLDQFAKYFVNGDTITIRGDIEKSKGRLGQIIVDTLGTTNISNDQADDDNRLSLFS
jgi:hypothetical protein